MTFKSIVFNFQPLVISLPQENGLEIIIAIFTNT